MIENLLVMVCSLLGAEATFYLIHQKKFSAVRASSGATLFFALLTTLSSDPAITSLQAAFFGATFVGMTSNNRMGYKRVAISSLLFALIFIFVLPLFKGFGGGLGTAAFISSAIVYFTERLTKRWLSP